tara:strand:- start:835 stop:1320 length:486 start_codon:yes stop_codon:yes gene_type:complete
MQLEIGKVKDYHFKTKTMNKEKFLKEVARQKGTNTNLKAHKVALALLDEFAYSDVTGLEDEVSRLGYSTEEWYNEKFDQFVEARGVLRDVYMMNSEAFPTRGDLARDEEILRILYTSADELGVPVTTLYPDYERHLQTIKDFEYYDKKFDEQKEELKQYGL